MGNAVERAENDTPEVKEKREEFQETKQEFDEVKAERDKHWDEFTQKMEQEPEDDFRGAVDSGLEHRNRMKGKDPEFEELKDDLRSENEQLEDLQDELDNLSDEIKEGRKKQYS